jgi:hypothetical protein
VGLEFGFAHTFNFLQVLYNNQPPTFDYPQFYSLLCFVVTTLKNRFHSFQHHGRRRPGKHKTSPRSLIEYRHFRILTILGLSRQSFTFTFFEHS